jgi:hypothetical protein
VSRLNAARQGQRVQVKGRQIDFSFWPSRPGRRHRGLQSRLFALDPWAIIRQTVENECPSPRSRRDEALATLEQAEDFYVMGIERGTEAAQPLALYYSYMNLSKAFCLMRGRERRSTRPSTDSRNACENHAVSLSTRTWLPIRLHRTQPRISTSYLPRWPAPR